MPSPEKAANGKWNFKAVDGILFVQVDQLRVRSKVGHLMEDVIEIKLGRKPYQDSILIIFKNEMAAGHRTTLKFVLKDFDGDANDLCRSLDSSQTPKMFCEEVTKRLKDAAEQETSAHQVRRQITTSAAMSDVQQQSQPGNKEGKNLGKRKRVESEDTNIPDLQRSPKAPKINSRDKAICSHMIGRFWVRVTDLAEPPEKWHDRPIDESVVNDIVKSLKANPTCMSNDQPWIAIADIRKSDFKSKEDIKGVPLTLIGGRHRKAAYLKVRNIGPLYADILNKVNITIYDNTLSDDDVRRLACMHNVRNKGSSKTKWMERVVTCRRILYEMAELQYGVDETPPSSKKWREMCREIYVDDEKPKDSGTLEPTLQAALLPFNVFNAVLEVTRLHSEGKIKDHKKGKSLTQNQLGMPLQGLDDATKLNLLNRVMAKELSLSELRKETASLKAKKNVQRAFMKFAGETSWPAMVTRFPYHCTEEKLAQFSLLQWTRKGTPEPAAKFFRNAVAWEKNKENSKLNLEAQKGTFDITSGEQQAIAMANDFNENLKEGNLKSAFEKFDGIKLTLINAEEWTEQDLRSFFVRLHSINADSMQAFNVISFASTIESANRIREVISPRFTEIQMAWFVDSSSKHMSGYKLQPSIQPVLICLWNRLDKIDDTNFHFNKDENASNVFSFKKTKDDLPRSLLKFLIARFSMEGETVLDVNTGNENTIVESLLLKRNCILLSEEARTSTEKAWSLLSACTTGSEDVESNDESDEELVRCLDGTVDNS